MPATGRIYGMTVNRTIDERLDPILAANAAARYLGDAHRKLGTWPLAITSYNHGQGGMANAKRMHGDDIGRIVHDYKGRYFGFSSRNFYASFMAAREVAGNPDRYFPEGVAFEPPEAHDRLVLHRAMPARRVASHYGLSVYKLEDMNLAWRKAVTRHGAKLPSGSTVWLPQGSLKRVAGLPTPAPVRVARAESRPAPVVAAVAKPAKKAKPAASSAAKTHVVKPNETLYRVALRYDLSIQELKRLNRMNKDDDTIRAGQRLRVSG